MNRRWWVLILSLFLPAWASGQPTYKLGVGTHLFPSATLKLEGMAVARSSVRDDPGFRLQFHFLQYGKTLAVEEARAQTKVALPKKDPGIYTVVLEVFYPSYRGGNEQKGKFQAISPYLSYQVLPGNPPKVQTLEPLLAVSLLCGKDKGKGEAGKMPAGYGYKLAQGAAADFAKAALAHAWSDPKQVRFEISVPAESQGTLRMHFLDGDHQQRQQKITVLGKIQLEMADFAAAGKTLDVHMTAQDTKPGKIEVTIENLQPTGSAVISKVEWLTPRR